MYRMFRRVSSMPLTRKVIILYLVFALLPLLALNMMQYSQAVSTHINSVQESESRLLESRIVSVRERMIQVEHVMETLSYSDQVMHLLSANYEHSRAQMILDLQRVYDEDLTDADAFLKNVGAYITLFMTREDVPEKYFGILHESRMDKARMEGFFTSSRGSMWAPLQSMYPSEISIFTSANPQVLPYYQKIFNRRRIHLGTLMAGVRPEILLKPLAVNAGDSAIAVYLDGEMVYLSGEPSMVAKIDPNAQHGQRVDGLLYLRMPISETSFTVLHALDYTRLRGDARQDATASFLLGVAASIAFLLLATVSLRLTMQRLNVVTRRIAHAQDHQLMQPLPVDGHDEVRQLSEAYNALIQRIQRQMDELLAKEQATRRAQVLALQYQMNPHFLFNALLWLQLSLEELEIRDLSAAVSSLGAVLRYNLSENAFAKLGEEVAHLQQYIDFLNIWRKNSIDLAIDWPDALTRWQMPRFTLQPLVENAVQHGFIHGQKLRIRIQIQQQDDRVICRVINDGKAIRPERLAEIEASLQAALPREDGTRGIGLLNLSNRLRLVYAGAADLRIECSQGWTRCIVTIPTKEAAS